MERLNIAIDGPAGAGKSTVAKLIAEKLKIHYLDTGAMYRALGLHVLRCGIDPNDKEKVEACMRKTDICVKYFEDGTQHTYLDGEDVNSVIRTPEISMAASLVSAFPVVRDTLSSLQRAVAREYDIVMDGREITTNVLPETKYKYFVTASPEVRAKRRTLELSAKNIVADYEEVLKDIKQRDYQDTTRAYMPLRLAEDAELIDTSELSIDEVLQRMLSSIEEKRNS